MSERIIFTWEPPGPTEPMPVFARLRAAMLDNVLAEDREAVGYAYDLALADLALAG